MEQDWICLDRAKKLAERLGVEAPDKTTLAVDHLVLMFEAMLDRVEEIEGLLDI